jgi:hypothetical protein
MFGGSVILFDDVDQADAAVFIAGDGEADGVGGAIAGEAVATAASVTAVAQVALAGFRRFDDIGRMGVARAGIGIAQG